MNRGILHFGGAGYHAACEGWFYCPLGVSTRVFREDPAVQSTTLPTRSTVALPGSRPLLPARASRQLPRPARSSTTRPCLETARTTTHSSLLERAGSGAKAGALDDAVLDTDFSGLPAQTILLPSWMKCRQVVWHRRGARGEETGSAGGPRSSEVRGPFAKGWSCHGGGDCWGF